jgi:hypothetical protein
LLNYPCLLPSFFPHFHHCLFLQHDVGSRCSEKLYLFSLMQWEFKSNCLLLNSRNNAAIYHWCRGTVLGVIAFSSMSAFAANPPEASSNQPTTRPEFSSADVAVDLKLSFEEKVKRHADILDHFGKLIQQAEDRKKQAQVTNRLNDYLAGQKTIEDIGIVLAPYAVAQEQASALIKEGYLLNDFSGTVIGKQGERKAVDPMTAVFFFTGERKGLAGAFAKAPKKSGPGAPSGSVSVNGFNVTDFIQFLSGKPLDLATAGILPAIRDAIIPKDDNGDIANAIRDPGKTPAKILSGIDDAYKKDNGDVGNAIKKIFGG